MAKPAVNVDIGLVLGDGKELEWGLSLLIILSISRLLICSSHLHLAMRLVESNPHICQCLLVIPHTRFPQFSLNIESVQCPSRDMLLLFAPLSASSMTIDFCHARLGDDDG